MAPIFVTNLFEFLFVSLQNVFLATMCSSLCIRNFGLRLSLVGLEPVTTPLNNPETYYWHRYYNILTLI